jgi:methyl-accepting chemotaxis protein
VSGTNEAPKLGIFSIRMRLVVAFAGLIALMAAMAGVGAWRLGQLQAVNKEMAGAHLRMERLTGEWLGLTRSNAVRATVLAYTGDEALGQLLTPAMEAASQRISELSATTESLLSDDQARALFGQMVDKRKAYLESRKEVISIKQAGDLAAAQALLQARMLPAVDTYLASIQALSDHYAAEVSRDAVLAAATAQRGRLLLAAFCAAGVLLALVSAWLIVRSIARPIHQAVAVARRVAAGDLTGQIPNGRRDEMGYLLAALAEMTTDLRHLLASVASSAGAVAESSAQIAQGNLDLSQRTEEQASTLEETASSMEELTSTVGHTADHARRASQLAQGASQFAHAGGAAVDAVVTAMAGISDSSRKIAEIIGVIDGIAFQTNILALNAAVEAARAGEQGRGFAVVAAEVRNLAKRSAAAAREIKGLISDSVQQVEAGAGQVDVAGRRMGDIVQAAQQVSELVGEIAAASQEQSSGIEQVNVAIVAMDQGVQQNASLVEEAAAATEAMKEQAATLRQLVARFRLDDDAAPARQPDSGLPAQPPAVIPFKPAGRPVAAPRQRVAAAPGAGRRVANGGWSEF